MSFEIFERGEDSLKKQKRELILIVEILKDKPGYAAKWDAKPTTAKATRRALNLYQDVSINTDSRSYGTIIRLKRRPE